MFTRNMKTADDPHLSVWDLGVLARSSYFSAGLTARSAIKRTGPLRAARSPASKYNTLSSLPASSWGLGIFQDVIVAAECDRIGPTLSQRIGKRIGVKESI